MPWSLRLGGHIRVQNIEDRGEQRAGGVRWKHLLIWLILKLHHIICVIWSWIFKSKSETLWNTIWLPSKLLTPHHTYPPASRSFFCLFCEWNTKYFLSAAGNLFRAPQHHTGGLEKPLWLSKLSLSRQSFQTLQLNTDQEAIMLLLLAPWKSERSLESRNECDLLQQSNVSCPSQHVWNTLVRLMRYHYHHHHHRCGFWRDSLRQGSAMGENQTPEKPVAALCLFSVSTIRSLPVSVLILVQDKQHLDLLQLLFTEGDFLWLPYIYIACSGFQFACYKITLVDYAPRWQLGRIATFCHSYTTTVPTALNLPFFLHFVPSHKKCI